MSLIISVVIAWVTSSGLSLAYFRFLGVVGVIVPAYIMSNLSLNPLIKKFTSSLSGCSIVYWDSTSDSDG